MSINYTVNGTKVLVSGDTFQVREIIKSFGARWIAASKAWEVAASKQAKLKACLDKEIALIVAAKAARPVVRAATAAVYVRPAERAGGRCRARGCGAVAVVGGYCRSCAHDEV